MPSLLIISCSAAKHRKPKAPVAALDRYDGVLFKVIKKYIREHGWPHGMEIAIISARYGLISAEQPIVWYEQRLNRSRAAALREPVRVGLRRMVVSAKAVSIHVNMGRAYGDMIVSLPELDGAVWASGGIGCRAAQLKRWLDGNLKPARVGASGFTGGCVD